MSLGSVLTNAGGWAVGCYCDRDNREEVRYAVAMKWLGTREHFAPAIPEGMIFYELTDAGIEKIGEIYDAKAVESARKGRQWYRDYRLAYLCERAQIQLELVIPA